MDNYEVSRLISSGSYGEVYKARRKTDGRDVAIKKMLHAIGPGGVESSWVREVTFLRELRHPQILDLVDNFTFRDNGTHKTFKCLVFEYYPMSLGGYLRDCRRKGTAPDIKSTMGQILRALEYCHARGVMHRDLKPDNILLDNLLNVRVADWGMARSYEEGMVLTPNVSTLFYR